MPRSHTRTSVKRGKWARYNSRRALDREGDRRRRLANRAARLAAAEARMLAELPPPLSPAPSAPPPLTLRLTLEIAGESHRITLRWCPLFKKWSLPKRRLFAGLGALLDRAPEIHAGR